MRRVHGGSLLVGALWACSPPGPYVEGPQGAVDWTPGRYSLEATVGNELTSQDFSADLTIGPSNEMSLNASSGICQIQSPSDVARDMERGQRSFECGDAAWTVMAIPGGVRGTIRASVLVEYRAETACPIGRQGPCYIMRTERVTRTEPLRVQILP
ncbi:MAG: hypothetical protein FJ207_06405 [Gemmatimonadetes bacterium]|nr:hypothetical protein [Gemmatimonadota bacterium]